MTYEEARDKLVQDYESQKKFRMTDIEVSREALEVLLFGQYGVAEPYNEDGGEIHILSRSGG